MGTNPQLRAPVGNIPPMGLSLPRGLGEIKQYLRRTAWENFPVLITLSRGLQPSIRSMQRQVLRMRRLADALVVDFLSESYLQLIMDLTANREPRLLAVHALEQAG